MKMLPAERELRKVVCVPVDVDDSLNDRVSDAKLASRLITAFRRAVVGDCAKVAEEWHTDHPEWTCCNKAIAATIRAKGKGR